MSAPPLLCAALEVALNRYLALDAGVLADCGRLSDRVIALHAQGPDWTFYLLPHAGGVQVLDAWSGRPQVRISATPVLLLRQALRSGAGQEAMVTGVQVEGDAELLSSFRELLARVGFDPEEWIARLTGDAAAHRVSETLQGLLRWGRQAGSTLALDTAEYLREETRDLVHRADVERWMDTVDRVRERTDRLQKRLEAFERRPGTTEARP
jgi:ubiquinone biosynthesis accessory factor UbiJ